MTNIQDVVIGALNAEIQSDPENPVMAYVGETLIDACARDEQLSERINAILEDGKTLKGAWDAIYAVAKDNKHSQVAMLTNTRVIDIALEHFGLTDSGIEAPDEPSRSGSVTTADRRPRKRLNLNIDELLA